MRLRYVVGESENFVGVDPFQNSERAFRSIYICFGVCLLFFGDFQHNVKNTVLRVINVVLLREGKKFFFRNFFFDPKFFFLRLVRLVRLAEIREIGEI